mgnify:CR=1 FL=1
MLKNKIKINMVMSVVLLVSMTIIACNMDKVATVEMEKENKRLINDLAIMFPNAFLCALYIKTIER